MKCLLSGLLIWLALATGTPAIAVPYPSGIIGGRGGEPFTVACPAHEGLIGFHARTSQSVNALLPLCGSAAWTSYGHVAWAGGDGGAPKVTRCPQGQFVKAMTVATTTGDSRSGYIDSIGLTCTGGTRQCLDTGEGCSGKPELAADERSADVVTARPVYCKPDEIFVGLVGRAGELIDAIGGLCGPRPLAATGQGRPVIIVPGSDRRATAVDPGLCKVGYVWRQAAPTDRVCVTPASRYQAAADNQLADTRRDPQSAYGPTACKAGFVWREAFAGDMVCVTPEVRDLVRHENAIVSERQR
jgi:hypothetical protein